MAYTVWVDADGFCNAELQITVETVGQAMKEKQDLVKMDCGKVVIVAHDDSDEADDFADFVAGWEKPCKVTTLFKKYKG